MMPPDQQSQPLSREFLIERGNCCGNGCQNCPYPTNGIPKVKTCPACGGTFECFNQECWCGQVPLSGETLAQLRQSYKGCLCRSCLEKMAAK